NFVESSYEDIVRKWYLKLRGNFTTLLMDKYRNSNISLADAENIYQDIFIAIHRNLNKGIVREETNWESYIIKIGLNLAGKKYRHSSKNDSIDEKESDNDDRFSAKAKRISDLLHTLPEEDDEESFEKDPQSQALLGEQLSHTPEPCASIIRLTYYADMTDAEISELIPEYRDNGKSSAVNAKAVKARRWLCMRDLIFRVKLSLYNAGIINEKPVKLKRNGK
ncbi:MAG: hypothetical protein K2K58_05890, partial [Muribaculaceae bacterium]|nr:hypothetical protein [Muribaculaceae bacterium]